MSVLEFDAGAESEQSRLEPQFPASAKTGLFQCLVVAIDPQRCEVLARAAADGGWQSIACTDADAARSYLARMLVQLTVVDLENPGGPDPIGFRELIEEISQRQGLLLVMCGKPGDWREELWARQLGSWLYLTGVETDGLTLICGEARQVCEQLLQAHRPSSAMAH